MARLLLVEDHEDTREFTAKLLELSGHEVTAVAGGAEALQSKPEEFDVILTDLNMPGMDGAALKRALDARGIRVPVIVVSGEAEAARVALRLGALLAIRKPASSAELEAAITQATAVRVERK